MDQEEMQGFHCWKFYWYFIYVKDGEGSSRRWLISQMPTRAGTGSSQRQEPGTPREWQGPRLLNHHQLPSRPSVHSSRKLKQDVEPGLEPGCGHPKRALTTMANTCPQENLTLETHKDDCWLPGTSVKAEELGHVQTGVH